MVMVTIKDIAKVELVLHATTVFRALNNKAGLIKNANRKQKIRQLAKENELMVEL